MICLDCFCHVFSSNQCLEVYNDFRNKRRAWQDWKTTILGGTHALDCMVVLKWYRNAAGCTKEVLMVDMASETWLCFCGMVYPYLSSHLDLRGAGVEDTVQLIALRNCALAHLRTTSILISTSVLFHTLKAPYSWLLHELHWQTNPPDMLLSHSY